MSIFASILKKLNLEQGAQASTKPAAAPPKPASTTPAAPKPPAAMQQPPNAAPAGTTPKPTTMGAQSLHKPAAPKPAAETRPAAIPVVDVMSKLEAMAAKRPEKLNWKVSISDLLFLLDIDNSYQARKELAEELGCPPELMGDSAKMNTWLHKTVLTKIAENGGNIPQELLD